jgi:hypothetical protein
VNIVVIVSLSLIRKRIAPLKHIACTLSTVFRFYDALLVASCFASPIFGMGTAPPGESGSLAVRISTPSSVIRSVCSAYIVSTKDGQSE